jgi:hypothetical protein
MRPLRSVALCLSLVAAPAFAHHGWGWTDSGEFTLTGTVAAAELGNPHGVLSVEVEGEVWTVEVGQPWRNAQAGLTDEMLAPGAELTAEGHRSTDPGQLLMKAERLVIDGQSYNLYPDRS